MCGFAGFIGPINAAADEVPALLSRMGRAIAHRGPDDEGLFWDPETSIGLTHRRLSIIDLSPAGHQPMHSACGRFVIAYNGEVYNFPEIRRELEAAGCRLRGDSDTEVVLEAIVRWGVRAALRRFAGMFAFALWDQRDKELTLARDRLGIKPLFYQVEGRKCIFASELKPLHCLPGWQPQISRAALAEFIDKGYISATNSIYEGVQKLPPGAILTFRPDKPRPEPEKYWSLRDVVDARTPGGGPDATTATKMLHDKLREAVRIRMVADVPLGAFLSGGIDSTTVVAIMQTLSARPVKTFTIGFEDQHYNEAEQAAKIAQYLGTDHTERCFSEQDILELVPQLPRVFDEPFADSSQLPMLLLAMTTREHVTTVLSGDGGDELFAGYVRHQHAQTLEAIRRWLPLPLRSAMAKGIVAAPEESWDRFYQRCAGFIPRSFRATLPGNKAHKFARVIASGSSHEMYRLALGKWPGATPVLGNDGETGSNWWQWPAAALPLSESYMYQDSLGYLHDDVLTKVDRCTMAVGLEARVPLLDHRVVEFAWTLPVTLKLRNKTNKYLLRRLLTEMVPAELWERPKMGFAMPVGRWLRTTLRDWADDLLAVDTLKRQGYLDPGRVSRIWDQHRNGTHSSPDAIWNLLMFQAWLEMHDR